MSKYYLKARLLPTILTAIPLIAVYIFVLSPYLSDYLRDVLPLLPAIGDVSFSVAIVFLLVQINRYLSKELLQRPYFKGELRMPTTDFLLYSNDEYSYEYKHKVRVKIREYFDLTMVEAEEESTDETRSRFLIKEAVSQIRALLTGNEMLLNHNIEYGAVRNFLGGCVQAMFFSVVLIIKALFFPYTEGLLIAGTFSLFAYFIPIYFGKRLITSYGNDYARILYQHFLAHFKPNTP